MKRFISTLSISILFLSLCFVSCDKLPENGKLDGYWQLMSIDYHRTGGVDSIIETKDSSIYWGVQLKLISFKRSAVYGYQKIYSRFSFEGDQLHMYNFYYDNRSVDTGDILATDSTTTDFNFTGIKGIKADFQIETLNSHSMVLNSDYARLTFRKF